MHAQESACACQVHYGMWWEESLAIHQMSIFYLALGRCGSRALRADIAASK